MIRLNGVYLNDQSLDSHHIDNNKTQDPLHVTLKGFIPSLNKLRDQEPKSDNP